MKKILPVLIMVLMGLPFKLKAQSPQYYKGPGATSSQFPFKNNGGAKCQLWYAPADFNTLPISGYITTIYFRSQYGGQVGTYTNFRVLMKQPLSGTGFSTSTTFESGGFTQAHFNPLQTINGGTNAGDWYAITLSTPFLYDNTLPLVVETQYDAPFSGVGLDNFASSTTLFRKIYASSLTATTGSASNGFWQDFGMDIIPPGPCTDPPTAGAATVSNASPCPSTTVMLNLSGNTQGTGQTYQWQSSTSFSGPWVAEGSSSASSGLSVTPPAGTTYYRCQVTCGATTVPSTPVMVVVPASFSGSYTINATQPASSTNFQSFSDAFNALNCTGITGNVVLNVAPGSGPYTGQLIIGAIPGTSPTSTVTIKGNGETISYASAASATRPTILLDGAKYVTIDSLNIEANGTTYGWGVHLTNDADNDTIKNCTISIQSTSTTASNTGGIVVSGSGTSVTTAGNSDNIVVMNNSITGGYQGVIMRGATATPLLNNKIIGNIIKDQYAVGVEALYTSGTVISNNDFSRPLRTTTTTYSGIELGAGNVQALVTSNKIHSTHTSMTTQSGIAYGIYLNACDAPVSQENIIANNLIYNFNSLTGIQNGLRNNGSDGSYFYHNTVIHDNPTSTSGATYAFYQTAAATNIEVKNNIFYITRGGSGTKHCVYFNTATSAIVSNNNVLYINAASGSNYIGRNNGNDLATLLLWQGDGFDLASSDQDPIFQNTSALDYTPTNSVINNIGTPIVSITTDINSIARSAAAPDPGAFENLNYPLDVTLMSFSAVKMNESVMINWEIAKEENMSTYEVQRSEDGKTFDKIGGVEARNLVNQPLYQYLDKNVISNKPTDAKIYYRLKMVEKNGSYKYSPVQTVSLQEVINGIAVGPNPFTDKIEINFDSRQEATISLMLTDLHGKIIKNRTDVVRKGSNTITIADLNGLPNSVYHLIIDVNGVKHTRSIVK